MHFLPVRRGTVAFYYWCITFRLPREVAICRIGFGCVGAWPLGIDLSTYDVVWGLCDVCVVKNVAWSLSYRLYMCLIRCACVASYRSCMVAFRCTCVLEAVYMWCIISCMLCLIGCDLYVCNLNLVKYNMSNTCDQRHTCHTDLLRRHTDESPWPAPPDPISHRTTLRLHTAQTYIYMITCHTMLPYS